MTRYAIDAPTLLELAKGRHAVNPTHQLVAPNSIRSLALELLLHQVRSGEISAAEALELHERMTGLKIRLLGDRVSRGSAWRIALEHRKISVQTAEFIAVAILQADALIANDAELASLAVDIVALASLQDVIA